jgi:hypothetical protein
MKWRAALEAAGAVYKRTCIWVKPDGKPQYSGDRPGTGYEGIVACHAPGRSTWLCSDSQEAPPGGARAAGMATMKWLARQE